MVNQRDNAFDRDGIGCHPFDANSDRGHGVCFVFRVAAVDNLGLSGFGHLLRLIPARVSKCFALCVPGRVVERFY
jgi:hypothetical protein